MFHFTSAVILVELYIYLYCRVVSVAMRSKPMFFICLRLPTIIIVFSFIKFDSIYFFVDKV